MAGNQNSGRNAKPAIVHLLRGNPSKKNVAELKKEIENPVIPVEAPNMPDWLDDEARKVWEEIIPDLLMLGLISKVDQLIIVQYCEAMADIKRFSLKIQEFNSSLSGNSGDVQTSRTGYKDMSVWRKLRNDAERRANEAGGKLGFSPLARRNLRVEPPQRELFPNEQRRIADKYFD